MINTWFIKETIRISKNEIKHHALSQEGHDRYERKISVVSKYNSILMTAFIQIINSTSQSFHPITLQSKDYVKKITCNLM